MQNIDKTINRLCAYIQTELITYRPKSLKQMPELVSALAQLVEAKAKLNASGQLHTGIKPEFDIDPAIEEFTKKLQGALKGGGIGQYVKQQQNSND